MHAYVLACNLLDLQKVKRVETVVTIFECAFSRVYLFHARKLRQQTNIGACHFNDPAKMKAAQFFSKKTLLLLKGHW